MSKTALNQWSAAFAAAQKARAEKVGARDAMTASLISARPFLARHAAAAPPGERFGKLEAGEERTVANGLCDAFIRGWHDAEAWGCWTSEKCAGLRFFVPPEAPRPVVLRMRLRPFLPLGGRRRVSIITWSGEVTFIDFDKNFSDTAVTITLCDGDVRHDGIFEIKLQNHAITAPLDCSMDDARIIGVGLIGVELVAGHPYESRCELRVGEQKRIGNGLEKGFAAGWYKPESWGCWTSELRARLLFQVVDASDFPFVLKLQLEAYLPLGGRRRLDLFAHKEKIGSVEFDAEFPVRHVDLSIAKGDVEHDGRLEILLEASGLSSPSEKGADDFRMLSVGLIAVDALCEGLSPAEVRKGVERVNPNEAAGVQTLRLADASRNEHKTEVTLLRNGLADARKKGVLMTMIHRVFSMDRWPFIIFARRDKDLSDRA